MVEYKILTRHDDPDLIDFINYVFSMDGEATDFVKLLPKAYEPESGHDILHLTLPRGGGRERDLGEEDEPGGNGSGSSVQPFPAKGRGGYPAASFLAGRAGSILICF